MFKLVILAIFDPFSKMKPREIELPEEYEKHSDAELRALRWLLTCPNDIATIVPLEVNTCVHCGEPIEEKVGWVLRKWVHSVGKSYHCRDKTTLREAAPKVVMDE